MKPASARAAHAARGQQIWCDARADGPPATRAVSRGWHSPDERRCADAPGLRRPPGVAEACLRALERFSPTRSPASTLLTEHCEDVSTMMNPHPYPRGALPPRLRMALDAMRHGRAVILTDDEDRENEGDLNVAADRITVPTMTTLI